MPEGAVDTLVLVERTERHQGIDGHLGPMDRTPSLRLDGRPCFLGLAPLCRFASCWRSIVDFASNGPEQSCSGTLNVSSKSVLAAGPDEEPMCASAESISRRSLPGCSEGSREAKFLMMLRAYASSGGMAAEPHALDRWRNPTDPVAPVDVVEPAIFVEWSGLLWVPKFQFEPTTLSIRPAVRMVIAELEAVFDMWELAAWFCEPNLWIGGHRPVDMVDGRPECVLGAARADRFIALG